MSVKEQKWNNATDLWASRIKPTVFLSDRPSITTAFEANPHKHAHTPCCGQRKQQTRWLSGFVMRSPRNRSHSHFYRLTTRSADRHHSTTQMHLSERWESKESECVDVKMNKKKKKGQVCEKHCAYLLCLRWLRERVSQPLELVLAPAQV